MGTRQCLIRYRVWRWGTRRRTSRTSMTSKSIRHSIPDTYVGLLGWTGLPIHWLRDLLPNHGDKGILKPLQANIRVPNLILVCRVGYLLGECAENYKLHPQSSQIVSLISQTKTLTQIAHTKLDIECVCVCVIEREREREREILP
ncbi:hypothetical protein L1987_30856 [Smallanthus sonchifolius]|uniref:Uncharacterized protein n=1 Tax=Smallanthus sonchifolius TaxID=185202 RepID=A0ACB9I5R7_9ASTR|nr:hypothetical protein L1987_30856 [Smallanthus sonchifolius]